MKFFQTSAECALFENEPNVIAKGDEERALIARLEAETDSESAMSEVEQRDACVRLQEIFQDRKTALNHIVETIEQSYEQILQVVCTPLNQRDEISNIQIISLNFAEHDHRVDRA